MGAWRMKGFRGDNEQGICPVCRKDEDWNEKYNGARRIKHLEGSDCGQEGLGMMEI
jgi:hypothetical protein